MSMITPTPQATPVERTEITISISGARLKLSAPDVSLKPSELRELRWKFSGEQPGRLKIAFKPAANSSGFESPFRGCLFRCPKGGGSLSGRAVKDKARAQAYKYTVTLTTTDAGGATTVRTATGSVTVPPEGVAQLTPSNKAYTETKAAKPAAAKPAASPTRTKAKKAAPTVAASTKAASKTGAKKASAKKAATIAKKAGKKAAAGKAGKK